MEITRGLAELAEAGFMEAYETGAPAEVREALGIATTRIGGGVALAARELPVSIWTRALGFGITEPITAEVLGEIVEFYRSNDVPAVALQIAPSSLPPGWAELSAAHGITRGAAWVKLGAAIEELEPKVSTRLGVGPVAPGEAERWAAVILRGYGDSNEYVARMLAAGVAHPDFRAYAAWDGRELVAGGSLYVHGLVGSLNTAATLPDQRRNGAQTALISMRVEAARREGCRWVVAETGLPAEGTSNPSLDNLERAGLRQLYIRHNWVWRAADDPSGRR
ncbi:hypothetical protein [Actinospica sp.]|uniref:hypothetical protein n=1 Tax=Actinospica sp. TaxID=1872142 RepID=UPI002CD5A42A|nr:hypothetical protein [Actinospica sp.]HWG24348.1 hypothetical protein [Actinospica sp.]